MKLDVIGYGHTVCWPDWGFRTDGEAFQRVYYVLGGSCLCTIEGRSFILQKDHLYLMPQHVPYAMSHDPADPFFVLWQHICLPDRDTGPHMVCRRVERGGAVWHVLCAMTELSRGRTVERSDGPGDPVARQLRYLAEALLMLLEQEQPLFTALDPRLIQVLRMVAEHPGRFYTVQELAQCVQLERSHFSRLFRSQFRIPAQTFLIRRRLEQAAQALLREGSVSEAAAAAGYADPKAFSRAFSGQYGISPAQYKKYHILQP